MTTSSGQAAALGGAGFVLAVSGRFGGFVKLYHTTNSADLRGQIGDLQGDLLTKSNTRTSPAAASRTPSTAPGQK